MTDEIWQFMKDLNNKWVKGHPEKLIDFFHDTGRDFFILIREGGKWLAVWRTIYL